MASLIDLLLALTDPGTAVGLGFIYLKLRGIADRVSRLEGTFIGPQAIPDGGTLEGDE